jgi:hypothetical protein
MRFYEFKTIKPLTPEQSRINSLKQQKERASAALKTERERQQTAKQLGKIQQANQVLNKIRST